MMAAHMEHEVIFAEKRPDGTWQVDPDDPTDPDDRCLIDLALHGRKQIQTKVWVLGALREIPVHLNLSNENLGWVRMIDAFP